MYDLHAHLTGSITGENLFDIIYEEGLYKSSREKINLLTEPFGIRLADKIYEKGFDARQEFKMIYTCAPNGRKRFAEIMQRFLLINYILESDPLRKREIAEMVGKEMERLGVEYVEWRVDPFSATRDQTAEEGAEKLLEFYEGLKKSSIDSRFIIGLAKQRYSQDNKTNHEMIRYAAEQTSKILDLYEDLPIVGLDAVNKEATPIRDLKPFFSLADTYGLGLSPHVGEGTSNSLEENLDTIVDALDLGAKRLGHAIVSYMSLDDYLGEKDAYGNVYNSERIERLKAKQRYVLSLIKESGAVIEVCPTSNMVAHLGIQDISQHPIDRLVENRIPFIVCSDDYGIFGSPLRDEIYKLSKAKHLDPIELERNAERYSFKNFWKR